MIIYLKIFHIIIILLIIILNMILEKLLLQIKKYTNIQYLIILHHHLNLKNI